MPVFHRAGNFYSLEFFMEIQHSALITFNRHPSQKDQSRYRGWALPISNSYFKFFSISI